MTSPSAGNSPVPPISPQPVPDLNLDQTAQSLVDAGSDNTNTTTPQLELRQAVITAVNLAAATCSVAIGGEAAANAVPNVHYLSNYKPTVNDTCWVLVNGPDILALDRDGKFGAAAYAGMASATVTGNQSRANTAYGDLATVGPTVNTTIPASGRVLICVSADIQAPISSSVDSAFMSFAISGATTLAASDSNALMALTYVQAGHSHSVSGSGSTNVNVSVSGSCSPSGSFFGSGSGSGSTSINGSTSSAFASTATEITASRVVLLTGLTPGAATVTAKYRSSNGGAAFFDVRNIWVLPL